MAENCLGGEGNPLILGDQKCQRGGVLCESKGDTQKDETGSFSYRWSQQCGDQHGFCVCARVCVYVRTCVLTHSVGLVFHGTVQRKPQAPNGVTWARSSH